jgi:hypothetical protein
MRRRSFLIAGSLAAVSPFALADDLVGETLNGYWLVSVEGEERERLLFLSGAHMDQGRVAISEGMYGWIDARRPQAISDWSGEVLADSLRFRFTAPSGSVVNVQLSAASSSVGGTIRYTNGKEKVIRMTLLPKEEAVALRAAARARRQGGGSEPNPASAQQPVPAATTGQHHARRGSGIVFLYVGTFDCPGCRGYELEYFGGKNLMTTSFPDFTEVEYVPVKLGSYRAAIRASDLPEKLQWTMSPQADGTPALHTRGYPFYAAVVDNHIWAQGHGISGLEAFVIPQLRRAVAERAAG